MKLYDTRSNQCENTYSVNAQATCLTLAHNSQYFLTGTSNGDIHVVDFDRMDRKQPLAILKGTTQNQAVTSIDISPKGFHVVAGYNDGTVKVWNLNTGKSEVLKTTSTQNPIIDAKFSPDGRYLGIADSSGNIHIYIYI